MLALDFGQPRVLQLSANHTNGIRQQLLYPKLALVADHVLYDLDTAPPGSDAEATLTTHIPSGSAKDSLSGCCQLLLQGSKRHNK